MSIPPASSPEPASPGPSSPESNSTEARSPGTSSPGTPTPGTYSPGTYSPEKAAFLDAEVTPFLSGAETFVPPPCPYFAECGGCHLQHLSYPDQLALKERFLVDVFRQRGIALPDLTGRIFGMADPWYYRNKADFNAKTYGGQVRIGFTALGTGRVIDIERCPIVSRPINDCLGGFKQALPEFPELKRQLHSVILRSSRLDDHVVALYHTKIKDEGLFNRLTARVKTGQPKLVGGGYVKRGRTFGEGPARLRESIGGMEYAYSTSSFFQANPLQCEVLVRVALEYGDPRPSDVMIDVYSGVGLFTLLFAQSVREVWAIEDTPSSVKDAIANAAAAGITNCQFLQGQAKEKLEQLHRTGVAPTLALLDPPRSGCSPAALDWLQRMRIPRIVMVSCNPKSLARDVEVLQPAGYSLEALSMVDMFPQTMHQECVALLTLR